MPLRRITCALQEQVCDGLWDHAARFAVFCLKHPLSVLLGLITGAVLKFWGHCPEGVRVILGVCLVLFLMDTLSGVMCAFAGKAKRGKNGKFESECFAGSLQKFLVYAIVIVTTAALDTAFRTGATLTGIFATIIMLRETSSIIEHTGRLGFRWPEKIVSAFAALEEQVEDAASNAVPTLGLPGAGSNDGDEGGDK